MTFAICRTKSAEQIDAKILRLELFGVLDLNCFNDWLAWEANIASNVFDGSRQHVFIGSNLEDKDAQIARLQ